MKKTIVLIYLVLGVNTFANLTLKIPKPLGEMIPWGYKVIEQIHGDLNKDEQDDVVLIVKKIDKSKIVTDEHGKVVDRNRRGVLIAIKNNDTYDMVIKNLSCFSSENEFGGVYFPPELYFNIAKGNLYFHYGHGRYGYWKYTFRYENRDFKLIGYDNSRHRGPIILEVISINFLTEKMLIKKNLKPSEESGKEVFKETWEKFSMPTSIGLSEIHDFDRLYIQRMIEESQ